MPRTSDARMLRPTHIAETALYVDDLDRSVEFYTKLFGWGVARRDERFCALRVADQQVLLLFRRGASANSVPFGEAFIPGHDGSGPAHVCFGMGSDDWERWERHLVACGIPVESRIRWPGGARSLYFRDPDRHAVELATPGIWD